MVSIKKMRHSIHSHVTLNQILMANTCYDPIARYGLEGMELTAPISFRDIAEVADAQDTIWCFASALPGHEALKRHFAVDCAERVRHLMDDPRSLAALEVARRHALGRATDEELTAARDAAWNAVWAARAAARDAWDAARAERDWQGQRLIEITEAGAWAPVGDGYPKLRESPGGLPNNNILRGEA